MKLMWFHLMPYTELPEDFREKHPSVWVDIHSSLFDPRRAHLMYNDFMDELEFAAECGFDAVCVNEHHSNGYGLMPSPNLIASALARRTTDTALCVMGNSLALYNPPTRVAEEFAMIDCISGGRLIAGFPVGTPMDTCFAYGQNPSMLRERYYEAHDLVMRAWTEQDTFAFNGRFNQQRYVNIWPRPVQKPHPPIWIPGGGSVETWQWCAEMDYVYAYLSYFGYKAGQATMHGFWEEMDRLGKDRNPYRAGFLQFVGVAETPRGSATGSTASRRNISTAAACMSTRALPARPAIPARRRSAPGSSARSPQVGAECAGSTPWRARWTRSSTRATSSSARPTRSPTQLQRGGDRPQCRPSDAAAAVRQHGQGSRQVQHPALRRESHAAADRPVLRMGGPLVAAADGPRRAGAADAVPATGNGGRVGDGTLIRHPRESGGPGARGEVPVAPGSPLSRG